VGARAACVHACGACTSTRALLRAPAILFLFCRRHTR
jgi:hypothetical protein